MLNCAENTHYLVKASKFFLTRFHFCSGLKNYVYLLTYYNVGEEGV